MATTNTGGRVVLDLDVDDRPKVKIDGTDYAANTRETLTPIAANRLAQLGRRMSELVQKAEPTDDEQKALEALPDQMCRLLLVGAPPAVHKKLNDEQRMQIVAALVGDQQAGA